MNLQEQLMAEMSRKNIDYITHYIGKDATKVQELFGYVFEGSKKLPLRAAWALSAVGDRHPGLIQPYIDQIIDRLETFQHTGIHRLFLRFLADQQIPENLEGQLYDLCFRWLLSTNEPPAVKVHCMQILLNIAQKEPDLKRELLLVMEDLIDHESAAIRSRSRKLLNKD